MITKVALVMTKQRNGQLDIKNLPWDMISGIIYFGWLAFHLKNGKRLTGITC